MCYNNKNKNKKNKLYRFYVICGNIPCIPMCERMSYLGYYFAPSVVAACMHACIQSFFHIHIHTFFMNFIVGLLICVIKRGMRFPIADNLTSISHQKSHLLNCKCTLSIDLKTQREKWGARKNKKRNSAEYWIEWCGMVLCNEEKS